MTKARRRAIPAFVPLALLAFAAGGGSPAAAANLDVAFAEGAPVDRFTIGNASGCSLREATLTIDLNGSRGGLVLDVTGTGRGVGVYRPLEVVEGLTALSRPPKVRDGDRSIELHISSLEPGGTIAFTLDLDDTKKTREITVADDELSGATLVLRTIDFTTTSSFEGSASTVIDLPDCDR